MSNNRLVYSTETGRIKKPSTNITSSSNTTEASDGIVRIHRETKGRKGNGVSIVKGIPQEAKALKGIAKKLKQKMGVGGSVKNGAIEIQSDQREALKSILEGMGYTVKIAGS